ncbi:MAG: helix-turn-helix domain-containing protein [Chloroflexota bacterium]|nr:helix-turn-helix domain-containing protein [Chloroflexota bacterium]
MGESSFGDLLRRHRVAVALTQQELAERAGMSLRGLSDLERSVRRAPHRDTVLRLAQALGLEDVESQALLAASRRQTTRTDISPPLAACLSLPLAMSTLVGREYEIEEVRARLQSARLVTLTGPGGIGKTRLALEVGRRLANGGLEVAMVELASVGDSALVHQTTAAALAIEEQPGTRHLATLTRALQARRMLVVLDNCEHVIRTCAELADGLLRSCLGAAHPGHQP